jgi:benzil reductase ((S)-benzoin forming)
MRAQPGIGVDRLALVTGTTSGIGHAVADALLQQGRRVVGVARRPSAIAHTAYEHVQLDLRDSHELADTLDGRLTTRFAERPWRRVGLVNNAADPGLLGPIAHLDVPRLADVFAVNVSAPIWLMGSFVRLTPPGTPLRIVNVSSRAAVLGIAGLGAYGSSKAALRLAAMVLAAELETSRDPALRERRISILSYEPGTVDTPMQANARAQTADVLPSIELFARFAADGHLVPPELPAREIIGFLESDGRERFVERRFGT